MAKTLRDPSESIRILDTKSGRIDGKPCLYRVHYGEVVYVSEDVLADFRRTDKDFGGVIERRFGIHISEPIEATPELIASIQFDGGSRIGRPGNIAVTLPSK